MAGCDPGTVADPFVVGVHYFREVVVGEDLRGERCTYPGDSYCHQLTRSQAIGCREVTRSPLRASTPTISPAKELRTS